MSGSSRASHTYSRCVVSLDAGISISWAADENGSYEHGQRHHQEEEDGFRARLAHAAPALEVLFDELEEEGHVFTAPHEKDFGEAQRGSSGMVQMCEVQVACKPVLTEPALAALAERISQLLVEPPQPEPVEAPPEEASAAVPVKPWWKRW